MKAKNWGMRTFSERKEARSGALASFHVLGDHHAEVSVLMVTREAPGDTAVPCGGR